MKNVSIQGSALFLFLFFFFFFLQFQQLFLFLNLFLIEGQLQYCVGFSHTTTWISHRCTRVPSLLNFPPTPCHPSRLSQSPSLSSLSHTANSCWLSVLHMAVYMFSWQSPRSSHPLLPPPTCHVKSVLCGCVSMAVLQIGSSVPSFQVPCCCS